MDNLPIPIQPEAQNMPAYVAQGVQPAGQSPTMPTSTDPKILLDQATAQVEQIVAATPLSPSNRAMQIQTVKAAYVKARYNIEIPAQPAQYYE